MLTYHQLTRLSTKDLNNRRRFHTLALWVVWCGASFALLASFAHLIRFDIIAYETAATSLWALLISIPVYRQKKRITAALRLRT